ncbi:MAG TPA: hypothetical protein VNK04_14100 [Gemmataceae bacterium]|nr:hypothetical protein [Gemmataceae bacterium]
MTPSSAIPWTAAAACLLLLAGGCGTEPAPLATVRGKVFYRGAPLGGGTIVFIPDADRGSSGPLARAEIQADGSYVLATDDQPGAVAGWHRVTVLAVLPPDPRQQPPVHRALVPRRYSDPDFSRLSCRVKPNEENVIDFHLE